MQKALKSGNQTGNAVLDAPVEYIFQLGRQLYAVRLQFWTRISWKMYTKGQIKKNHQNETHFTPKLQILSFFASPRNSSKVLETSSELFRDFLKTPRNTSELPRNSSATNLQFCRPSCSFWSILVAFCFFFFVHSDGFEAMCCRTSVTLCLFI